MKFESALPAARWLVWTISANDGQVRLHPSWPNRYHVVKADLQSTDPCDRVPFALQTETQQT